MKKGTGGRAGFYLKKLCTDIGERSTGSPGNRRATSFFKNEIQKLGWEILESEFQAMDWIDEGAEVICVGVDMEVFVSPYSNGCDAEGCLVTISDLPELETKKIGGKIVLLHGDIAKEQLMPKNFIFYNPEEHQKIIRLLEVGQPEVVICATGRNASLAGGVYPFPLIEDGDFDIPSVYMTEEEGRKLIPMEGRSIRVRSRSERISGAGFNITGRRGRGPERIVITAHIDAKKGTPGAIDNGTGVVVLLLLADLLKTYNGETAIELVAFNGEDYYAVPGQMLFIKENRGLFDNILLNINIDGAGFREGKTAFSFYGVPDDIQLIAENIMVKSKDITKGGQWPQGDHSIFIQFGRPAIAVSSEWFTENISSQEITHTPKDHPGIVDLSKLGPIAGAIRDLILELDYRRNINIRETV